MVIEPASVVRAAISLLPVLCFLLALLALDSYKLVRLRMVAAVIALGCLAAGLSYVVNLAAIRVLGVDFSAYSRFGAPLVEEAIKSSIVLLLIRTNRIGFLVDASVFGFAVGTGFALIENLYYLNELADTHVAVWIVRGFGTAILHGGVQSIFAALVLTNVDQRGAMNLRAVGLPLIFAALVHAAFNQFALPPIYETLAVLLSLPPLMLWVFARSERALQGWIGADFDSDQEMLQLLASGTLSESPVGHYLHDLRARFSGEVIADLLCYLRLHCELALRAKGVLLMRENGLDVPIDEHTREKLEEMHYLERSVGPSALRTVQPLLSISRRDLWQIYMLGK